MEVNETRNCLVTDILYRKMSSEQVTNIHICSGSDIAVNRAD